ncbi:MAG: glycosyltransferase family 4 protein [Candidatus Woesearchaeota archaeon]
MNKKNLAVIASRLKCVDAISVEADKWIDKYVRLGYDVHLISGKLGEPVELKHFELPEMDYKHPEVRGIKRIMFSTRLEKDGKKAAEILLNNLVRRIKGPLKNYLIKNRIQVVSIEDGLVSLKNIPLCIALAQIVTELNLPTISRIHYLPWENPYFTKFDNFSKILQGVPPSSKNIVHITNTEYAQAKMRDDRKLASKVIPNTVDIAKIGTIDDYNRDFRKALGIGEDQLIFLQPTRVKRNKFVERSIKLVAELNDAMKKDNVLIITGSPIYTRGNYFEEIVRKIDKTGVKVIFANDKIFLGRHENPNQKFYSINDAYANADIILYPNTSDAFGNPLIEAFAYKKPVVVNSFPNLADFEKKGFRFIRMDQKVDAALVSDTYELIMDKDKAKEMTDHNFELLKKHFSSDVLEDTLIPVLNVFDNQKTLISKVTGFIPDRFWKKNPHRNQGSQPNVKKVTAVKVTVKVKPTPAHNKPAHDPEEDSETKSESDLRNRKGGYKEPTN